jgi:predicted nucleotidyltransferase
MKQFKSPTAEIAKNEKVVAIILFGSLAKKEKPRLAT